MSLKTNGFTLILLTFGVGPMQACGDEGPMPVGGAPVGESRTDGRLVSVSLDNPGAPSLSLGRIVDTKMNVPCAFVEATDGQLRCLPENVVSMDWPVRFADDKCRQGVWEMRPANLVTVALPRAACGPILHEVHEVVPVLSIPLFELSGSDCVPRPPEEPSPRLDRRFSLGDVVPPTLWVAGREEPVANPRGRLEAREILTGADQTFFHALVDARWGHTCTFKTGKDGIECWVENNTSSYFSERTCGKAPDIFAAPSCDSPAFLGFAQSYFSVGEKWMGEVFFRSKGCFLEEPAGVRTRGLEYFRLGPKLEEPQMAAPAVLTLVGTGRLQLRQLDDGTGHAVPLRSGDIPHDVAPYYDTLSKQDCRPVFASDTEVYCVPLTLQEVWSMAFFDDARCTSPVYMNGDVTSRDFILRSPTGEGPPQGLFGPSLPVRNSSVYASLGDGRCEPFERGDDEAKIFVRLGPQISWDKYPRLKANNMPAPLPPF